MARPQRPSRFPTWHTLDGGSKTQAGGRPVLEECLYEFNARQPAYRTESFLAYSCEPLMGLQSRAPLVGRGEELATSAISSLQRTCVGAAKALCLCAQYRRRPISRDCRQIVLETFDFQAFAFYQKFGFEEVGRVEDYPLGHQYLILVKRLP